MMDLSEPRYYLLAVLTFINVTAFWHRNLLMNLTAVQLAACSSACGPGVPFVPLCLDCADSLGLGSSDELAGRCSACQECRRSEHAEDYLIQDSACFDNRQFGLLAGVGFAAMFSVVSVLMGRLADRMDRRTLLVWACALWSAATLGFTLGGGFYGLLAARVLMGIGQAVNAPAAYPIILSLFGPESRSTANGICA